MGSNPLRNTTNIMPRSTRAPKRLTNTQMLTQLMEFAKAGPLMQAFILEAIGRYAKECAKQDPAVFDSPILVGAAWHSCAVEARDTIEKHLKS